MISRATVSILSNQLNQYSGLGLQYEFWLPNQQLE
jgi:hypothetical protein